MKIYRATKKKRDSKRIIYGKPHQDFDFIGTVRENKKGLLSTKEVNHYAKPTDLSETEHLSCSQEETKVIGRESLRWWI